MIIQACINGRRGKAFHPATPTTPDAIAADAAASVRAGAHELHIHIYDESGRETLRPDVIDATMIGLRAACPGTLIGISTGAWIEQNDARRRDYLRQIAVPPDYASVNVGESDCAGVIDVLRARGIGVELGIALAAEARQARERGLIAGAFRLLYEIPQQDEAAALDELQRIERELSAPRKQILLHGEDAMMWRLIDAAFARNYATRVGLEDGKILPDGAAAPSNAALIAAAHARRMSAMKAIHKY